MLSRVILFLSVVAAVIGVALLFFTSPVEIGPLGVLLFFIAVYFAMLGVSTLVVKLYVRMVQKRGELKRKEYAYAFVLAFFPVIVMMLLAFGVANILLSAIGSAVLIVISLFLIQKIL